MQSNGTANKIYPLDLTCLRASAIALSIGLIELGIWTSGPTRFARLASTASIIFAYASFSIIGLILSNIYNNKEDWEKFPSNICWANWNVRQLMQSLQGSEKCWREILSFENPSPFPWSWCQYWPSEFEAFHLVQHQLLCFRRSTRPSTLS